MKTIIVPIDFSDESLTGLNLAFMLAEKTGEECLQFAFREFCSSNDKQSNYSCFIISQFSPGNNG
jgi:hypothetical protein